MRRAGIGLKAGPGHKAEVFRAGLLNAGFEIGVVPARPEPGDVLLLWNRIHLQEEIAQRFERAGASVIVAENGWVTPPGNERYFSICLNQHNGAGTWVVGEGDRWEKLGVPLKPWRQDGKHILVLAQRGIGAPGVAMPRKWTDDVVQRLKEVTDRPIIVRKHPGLHPIPLEPQLKDCWAAVTWASGAGIKSIVAGVPVFYEMPKWLGASAARYGLSQIEKPFLGDRLPMLRRMAWAQWAESEVATGEPFRCLLS